jgi:hypothetical protein
MRDELWNRIESALDARRSPFDDPGLAAGLRADPESERAVRTLLARLARLQDDPRARGGRRGIAAAATVLLVSAGAWLALRERLGGPGPELARGDRVTVVVERRQPPPPRCARIELAPRRVLAWTLEGETR